MTPRRRVCEAGFTLVELLVAVTLLALLTTLVFGAIKYGARAWAETDHRAVAAADLSAVQDVFRHAIGGAYPAFASADPTDREVAFDGAGEWLALVAPLPAAIASGVEAQQRFFVEGADYWLLGLIPTNIHFFGTLDGSPVHFLGTDKFGRDQLSRVLYGETQEPLVNKLNRLHSASSEVRTPLFRLPASR